MRSCAVDSKDQRLVSCGEAGRNLQIELEQSRAYQACETHRRRFTSYRNFEGGRIGSRIGLGAAAVEGIPFAQGLESTGKVRVAPATSDGGPNDPENPAPFLVSAMRQGVIG